MTSRERVKTALNHEAPDRVPIDLGGTVVSTIAIPTYAALRRHLGLPEKATETLEVVQQVARVDEDMLDRLGADVIPVFANPPDTPPPVFSQGSDGTLSFQDDFGATLKKPAGCHYFDWQEFPLPEPSLAALAQMPWPNPADPGRFRGLRNRVQALRVSTDRALFGMAPCGHDLFNQLFRVRGMENGLMDLVAEPEFAEAFFDRLCDTQKVLPYGTPAEVREEVRQRIRDLAPGGGFVFNPVHNIQPLVPPANVAAMFGAALEFGMYNKGNSR